MEASIKVGEFRGNSLYSERGYGHLFADLGRTLVMVPRFDHGVIDPEGPITFGTGFHDQKPVTAEEESYLRPIFLAQPARIAAWREFAAAKANTARSFEQAQADRQRNLSRYGLSDSPADDTAALCEAEGTPLQVPSDDRNPGGRCPECGYSHGHRMDCVFV